METKRCNKCGAELPATEEYFHKHKGSKDGLRNDCKKCIKEYHKTYYIENKEYINARNSNWWNNNREHGKILSAKCYQNNRNRKNEQNKIWKDENRERVNELSRKRMNEKYKADLTFRISSNISCSIWRSLKGNKKHKRWESLVGYNIEQLKEHLEKQFKPGMTWENYGEWHIDHRRPIASFNFTTSEDPEFKECWALENLQPLWAEDNLKKNSLWNGIRYQSKALAK